MPDILVDLRVDHDGLKKLQSMPDVTVDVVEHPDEAGERRRLPKRRVTEVEILACTFPPANIDEMESLRLVQIASAGFAQLVGIGLPERGVRACNALGVFDVPIAEWNISMMVNLLRDLRGMIRNQDSGRWDRDVRFQRELRGLTVGLWGYGGIGRETARLANALGMRVHVLTRSGVRKRVDVYRVPDTGDPAGILPDRVFVSEERYDFLAGLDFLVLAMPLTAENEGIVGSSELRALPETAYLLNPARGPLIQQEALLDALEHGWIAGAALDTHYQYPMPPEHPLWSLPNVIMTPHISGSSGSPFFLKRVWDILLQNAERFQHGRPLLNELDPMSLKS